MTNSKIGRGFTRPIFYWPDGDTAHRASRLKRNARIILRLASLVKASQIAGHQPKANYVRWAKMLTDNYDQQYVPDVFSPENIILDEFAFELFHISQLINFT